MLNQLLTEPRPQGVDLAFDTCRGRDAGRPDAPRTDPYVQDCCIRLLPWMNGVEAHVRMRMQDLRTWNPSIDQRPEPFPSHLISLTPPPKRAVPAPDYLSPKGVQTIHVAGYRMVVEVALYDRPQPLPDIDDRLVPASPKLLLQLIELRRESLTNRLSLDDEPAGLPGRPAQMRET